MRTFLARIIEGDPRRGARVDLSLDLWPKALSLNGSPPSSLSNITKVTMELPRCGRAGNQENGWRDLRSAPLQEHKLDRSGALTAGRQRRACKT